MAEDTEKPWILRVLPDALAFGIGLGTAYFRDWETRDFAWSLWLCNLVLGYLTLLSFVGGGAYIGFHAIRYSGIKAKQRVSAVLFGIAIGLFFLGFFSLHFCGFHAGHSVFLQHFFPIKGVPEHGFIKAFMNPPLLWVLVFRHLMRPYGLFLFPAIIAERGHVFRPLVRAAEAVRIGTTLTDLVGDREDGNPGRDGPDFGNLVFLPYLNVVRMHLLILFFGFCHALKVGSFFLYAVVYGVYFFPWSVIKQLRASKRPGAVDA